VKLPSRFSVTIMEMAGTNRGQILFMEPGVHTIMGGTWKDLIPMVASHWEWGSVPIPEAVIPKAAAIHPFIPMLNILWRLIFFTKNIGINGEFGYNATYANIGVVFKLK